MQKQKAIEKARIHENINIYHKRLSVAQAVRTLAEVWSALEEKDEKI